MSEEIRLPPGSAILLDALGGVAILTLPKSERAILLDLGGRLNRTEHTAEYRYLLRPEQAAELIAELMTLVIDCAPAGMNTEQAREWMTTEIEGHIRRRAER